MRCREEDGEVRRRGRGALTSLTRSDNISWPGLLFRSALVWFMLTLTQPAVIGLNAQTNQPGLAEKEEALGLLKRWRGHFKWTNYQSRKVWRVSEHVDLQCELCLCQLHLNIMQKISLISFNITISGNDLCNQTLSLTLLLLKNKRDNKNAIRKWIWALSYSSLSLFLLLFLF